MSLIELADANAWSEKSKLTITTLDVDMLSQIETQVLAALSSTGYNYSAWVASGSTPKLVKSIIAMLYVAWAYDKAYAEDVDDGNAYAKLLRSTARANIAGILDGTFALPEDPLAVMTDAPAFYPTDESSLLEPTCDDPSLGGPAFSMGQRW